MQHTWLYLKLHVGYYKDGKLSFRQKVNRIYRQSCNKTNIFVNSFLEVLKLKFNKEKSILRYFYLSSLYEILFETSTQYTYLLSFLWYGVGGVGLMEMCFACFFLIPMRNLSMEPTENCPVTQDCKAELFTMALRFQTGSWKMVIGFLT